MNVRLLGLDGVSIRELTDEEIADLMQGMSASKGELFHYSWHNGPRSSIDAGCAALDGQVIQYANNPVVCQAVWDGKQNAVLEENWAANKNCWSRGDGATWVRVPNLNMADGSAKPFYLRGGPDSLNGTWVGDALKAHGHRVDGASINQGNSTGYHVGIAYSGAGAGDKSGSSLYPINAYRDDFVTTVVGALTADENRVKTAYGVYTVRVFTEVSNTGAIDAAQLATQLGVVDAAVQALEAQVGFVIIYPNGGTAASPGNVSLNSRYVMPNPFPGRQVICVAEVQYAGEWFETGWALGGSNGGYGVKASQLGDQVVVQVGRGAIFAASGDGGAPLSIAASHSLPTLCRVKVWK
nr:hypothetical protein [uncultured Comamonas sp.]